MTKLSVLALGAEVLLLGCGSSTPSKLNGIAAVDSVTASLKAAFAAASPADVQKSLASIPEWDCLYHATNRAVAFAGAPDVEYTAEFQANSFLTMEMTSQVHAGPVGLPDWQHWLAPTKAGLEFDGDGEADVSEVIRVSNKCEAIVEFVFVPMGFLDPGNISVTDPNRSAAGYALCTPGKVPLPAPRVGPN